MDHDAPRRAARARIIVAWVDRGILIRDGNERHTAISSSLLPAARQRTRFPVPYLLCEDLQRRERPRLRLVSAAKHCPNVLACFDVQRRVASLHLARLCDLARLPGRPAEAFRKESDADLEVVHAGIKADLF